LELFGRGKLKLYPTPLLGLVFRPGLSVETPESSFSGSSWPRHEGTDTARQSAKRAQPGLLYCFLIIGIPAYPYFQGFSLKK